MPKPPGEIVQLTSFVDCSRPRKVLTDAKRLFAESFPSEGFRTVERAFKLVRDLYAGHYPGFRPCAVEYHDYAHTLSVFAAASRILDGCVVSGLGIGAESARDLLAAALLHDCGYIQETGDAEGTGAKYTKVHVDRSAAFSIQQAETFGFERGQALRVARLILGTDLGKKWERLDFSDAEERRAAAVLASADILGQMADRTYLEKLLFLYYEFREAGIEGYSTAFDILRKTAAFYESTELRLDGVLAEVSRRAREHFARRHDIDRDLYREAVERNMSYLAGIIADDRQNFRKKLKRLDLERVGRARAL